MPDINREQLAKAVDGMEIVVDLLGDVVPGTWVGAKIRYPGSFASDIFARCTEQDLPPEHRADPEEDARIAAHARRLRDEIGAAELAIGKAHQTRLELGRMHYEMSDDAVGRSVADGLVSARRSLLDAALIADEFLRPIEDAEKDAELERLRAKVDQLQRRLADHACAGNRDICGDRAEQRRAEEIARSCSCIYDPADAPPCTDCTDLCVCGHPRVVHDLVAGARLRCRAVCGCALFRPVPQAATPGPGND